MSKSLHFFKTRLGGALKQLPYLRKTLALVWAASRRLTCAWAMLLVVQGLLPVATVYLTRFLVNYLVAAIRAGGTWQATRPALVVVALLASAMLLAEILTGVIGWIRTAQSELVQDHITSLIHKKSVAADLAFYETPDFYDQLHRARAQAGHRPIALLENLGTLLQNGVTLIGMAAVLLPYGFWLPMILMVSTLPAFCSVLYFAVRHHQWYLKNTADERRISYYDWLLTDGETAVELRLFGIGNHFVRACQALRQRLRGERMELSRAQTVFEFGAGAIALGFTGCALAWMGWRALRGLATLGDLALFYQAFNQGQILMRSLLANAGQIYANVLFLGNLFAFLELQPKVVDPPHPMPAPSFLKYGICFEHVNFQYPGSERMALQDFSLAIPAGQIAAIVGPNGAGKSTLIKLLCRFYDPDQGRIKVDDTNLREFRVDDLRRRISVLFQVPVHYNATVRENIGLGDLWAVQRYGEIEAAACAAGAKEFIAGLPKGYENMLGRWIQSGAELSVGEWQKIALARAFLRSAPILLLDEPTSAMDSWAEADWLERFRQLAAGRTVVIITHRLTTAMHADIIHVMGHGRIAESGTHSRLLAKGGRYAESWGRQMEEACV